MKTQARSLFLVSAASCVGARRRRAQPDCAVIQARRHTRYPESELVWREWRAPLVMTVCIRVALNVMRFCLVFSLANELLDDRDGGRSVVMAELTGATREPPSRLLPYLGTDGCTRPLVARH